MAIAGPTDSKGGRPQTRPRTGARVAAVQALFQSEQADESGETVIDQFTRHRLGAVADAGGFEDGRVPDAHVPLFASIVRAAVRDQDQIDALIAESLPPDWPFDRLDPVLRALLRAGTAELRMANGPPIRVVINEYLDVAHGFFSGDEPRMVNGMLDALARRARPAEFGAAEPASTESPPDAPAEAPVS
jgi:N utilization substance protein B